MNTITGIFFQNQGTFFNFQKRDIPSASWHLRTHSFFVNENAVLKIFEKFVWNHLCWTSDYCFKNKVIIGQSFLMTL